MKIKKYQNCNLVVKMWRRRWQLVYYLMYLLYKRRLRRMGETQSKFTKDLFISMWQIKANWVYSLDDAKIKLMENRED